MTNYDIRIQVKNMLWNEPTLSAAEIGRRLGISRAYVSKILGEAGISTFKPKVFNICAHCGKETTNKKYCDNGCKQADKRIELHCPICGIIFEVTRSYYNYRKKCGQETFACSTKCNLERIRDMR